MLVSESNAAVSSAPDQLSQPSPVDWKQIISSVEPFLGAVQQRLAEQVEEFDQGIAALAEYALSGQGKQLRPALVALSAEATGNLGEDHVQAAVIIEMVHLATLVHDDVMDEASMRRQRPTLATHWGNETAVLLGDCLFAHALKMAAGFPTPVICREVAAAANTVCAGEILQTQSRHQFGLTREGYFKVLQMKTGELFGLSCDLGGYLALAEPEQRATLRRFGLSLGTAYQIFDDCLDLFGQETAVGKSLGTDLLKGKLTLPILLLLERLEEKEAKVLQKALKHWDTDGFPALKRKMDKHQVLVESGRVVQAYLVAARQELQSLNAGEGRSKLEHLAEYLEQQMALVGKST